MPGNGVGGTCECPSRRVLFAPSFGWVSVSDSTIRNKDSGFVAFGYDSGTAGLPSICCSFADI
jgi:hypothetical protein